MAQKSIFFDYENVIAEFSVDDCLDGLARIFYATPFDIKAFFIDTEFSDGDFQMPFWHIIESFPYWTPEKIYEEFCRSFQKEPDYDYFIHTFNESLRSNFNYSNRFLTFSKRIKEAGHTQGLISNTNSIHSRKIDKELSYLVEYIPPEFRFYSWKMGHRKGNDPVLFNIIFAYLEKFFGLDRKTIIYIDDRQENLVGCERAGATGLLFNMRDGIYCLEERLGCAGILL